MTDALMRIMGSQAAERKKRYGDVFKAGGGQENPAAGRNVGEADTPDVEMHTSPESPPSRRWALRRCRAGRFRPRR